MTLPCVTEEISVKDFQGAFKAVSKKVTSSPSGLHYTLWKVLAQEDDIAQWLSIMMSLPFICAFVSECWKQTVNAMLAKKPGVRKIHQLQIIGILEADFKTTLKILFARKLMKIAEKTGLSDEQ